MTPSPTARLDVEVRQFGFPGPQMSHLWTFLWGYVKDRVYKTHVNGMDHLKEKIREAVASVSRVMISATWKELHLRLVFLSENTGDHVVVFRWNIVSNLWVNDYDNWITWIKCLEWFQSSYLNV